MHNARHIRIWQFTGVMKREIKQSVSVKLIRFNGSKIIADSCFQLMKKNVLLNHQMN